MQKKCCECVRIHIDENNKLLTQLSFKSLFEFPQSLPNPHHILFRYTEFTTVFLPSIQNTSDVAVFIFITIIWLHFHLHIFFLIFLLLCVLFYCCAVYVTISNQIKKNLNKSILILHKCLFIYLLLRRFHIHESYVLFTKEMCDDEIVF